jgi:hypothetical protein
VSWEVEESVAVRVAEIRRCSDGIVEVNMAEQSRVSIEDMAALLEAQFHVTPKISGLLVDARGTVSMGRKALEMAANNPVNDRTVATALLVGSPVSTLLVNFFVRFARPPYPARAFRDPKTARQWLLEHLAGKS